MNLIKVDGLCLKPLQTGIECLPNIFWTRSFFTFGHFDAELRGDDCFFAPAFETPTEKPLALSSAVNVCGIEKVAAGIQCGIDYRSRSFGISPPPEVVAADANKGEVKM